MSATDPFAFEDDFAPDGFDGDPKPTVRLTKPPLQWLVAGLVAAVGGCVLAWLADSVWMAALGWFLAGPVGLTVMAWYLNRDNAARTGGVYSSPGWVRGAYIAVFVVCLVAVVLAAVRVAWGVGMSV